MFVEAQPSLFAAEKVGARTGSENHSNNFSRAQKQTAYALKPTCYCCRRKIRTPVLAATGRRFCFTPRALFLAQAHHCLRPRQPSVQRVARAINRTRSRPWFVAFGAMDECPFRPDAERLRIDFRMDGRGKNCGVHLCADLFLGSFRAGKRSHRKGALVSDTIDRAFRLRLDVPHRPSQLLSGNRTVFFLFGGFLEGKQLGAWSNCAGDGVGRSCASFRIDLAHLCMPLRWDRRDATGALPDFVSSRDDCGNWGHALFLMASLCYRGRT